MRIRIGREPGGGQTQGWLGGAPCEPKMLKGHLPKRHISPSILVYEDYWHGTSRRGAAGFRKGGWWERRSDRAVTLVQQGHRRVNPLVRAILSLRQSCPAEKSHLKRVRLLGSHKAAIGINRGAWRERQGGGTVPDAEEESCARLMLTGHLFIRKVDITCWISEGLIFWHGRGVPRS